nr:serine/threonine-protein kinase UCN-like [Tanacetum cinerariifolium]
MSPLPNLNNLKTIKVLGTGATGTVFLVHNLITDPSAKTPFALKVVDKTCRYSDKRTHWEINVLSNLNENPHPFLPYLIGSCETNEFISWAIPYCHGRDLNVLRYRQPDNVFSVNIIRFYLAEIVCALEHLHSLGIVYRDLKPENILIQESGHVTLTDFDLSRKLTPSYTSLGSGSEKKTKNTRVAPVIATDATRGERSNSFVGTEEYLSPEMVRGDGHEFGVDWWAVGILAYEMLYGSTPFRGKNRKDTYGRIVAMQPKFNGKSTPLKDFITKLLDKDPTRRENILIQESGHVTLTDFDLSRKLTPSYTSLGSGSEKKTKNTRVAPVNATDATRGERSNSFVGTEEYLSPEMVRGDGHEFGVDWWAVGILAYEMLYGSTPFRGKNRKDTYERIVAMQPKFNGKSTPLKDFITKLLDKDPTRRLGYRRGACEIKEHPFFVGLRWDMLTEVVRPPYIPSRDSVELTVKSDGIDIHDYFRNKKITRSSLDSVSCNVSLTEF